MGNKSSRPANDFAELVQKSSGQLEQTYSKERIEEGLKTVAEYLASEKLDVAIVAIGGAVNTVLLKSRASTGDVDFFYRTKDSASKDINVVHKIMEGARRAEKKHKLDSHWLNNNTVTFIKEELLNELYDQAIKQDKKLFAAKGLTVYAAPWHYAMMTKLDRASKRGAKSYDITDAVDYLECLITSRKGHAVKESELRAWAARYSVNMPTETVIEDLAKRYKEKHKKDGILVG